MAESTAVSVFVTQAAVTTDRTGMLSANRAPSWTLNMGQRGSASIAFEVAPAETFAPMARLLVEIYENYRLTATRKRVFAGIFTRVDAAFESGNSGQHQWQVSCASLEAIFDSILVPPLKFTDTTAGNLVGTIFDAIADQIPFGITLGIIEDGVTISDRSFDGSSSAASAWSRAATDSGKIWYIDPEDGTLNFHAMNTRAAPFVITNGMMLFSTIRFSQDSSGFADVRVINLNPNIAPPDVAVFPGDGSTTDFVLPKVADSVVGVSVINGIAGVHAEATGTFSSNPAPGDTVIIGDDIYTWASSIDNTLFGRVLIGATDENSCQNLVDAINAGPGRGARYSSGTWINPKAQAHTPFGSPALQFFLEAKVLGTFGNGIPLGATGAAFAWSDTETSGGEDLSGAVMSVGPDASGAYDASYEPGGDSVSVAIPPRTGSSIAVTYRASGGDKLFISNGASASLGVPTAYGITNAIGARTLASALAMGQAALAAYSQFPAEVSFQIDRPGIKLAQWVTIDVTVPAIANLLLNGNWVVKQISGTFPSGKWQKLPEPFGHFRYTITLVNSLAISNYKDTLQKIFQIDAQKQIPVPTVSTPGGAGSGFPPVERAVQLNDLTVGDNIAGTPPILTPITAFGSPPVHAIMRALRILVVLKLVITADLTIRINKITYSTSPITIVSWTVTVPLTWPVGLPFEQFISGQAFDKDVLQIDVVASDGQKDKNGVCDVAMEFV